MSYTETSGYTNLDLFAGNIGSETYITTAANIVQSASAYKSRYVVTNTAGATITFTLGPISTSTTDIQNGYFVMIFNDSASTGDIQILNNAASVLVTIPAGYTAVLVAETTLALNWTWFVAAKSVLPVPNNDRYCALTNQLINLNLVDGVIGNTSGADTGGNGGSNPITSVTILKNPSFGTLTATGPVGAYTYRSNPRFVGTDYIAYNVTDSTGMTSANTATCFIEVQAIKPITTDGAQQLIYISPNNPVAGQSTIYEYNATGTDTLIFTDTTAATGNALATNNTDNLIYWATGAVIKAYDFANAASFTVVDAAADARFTAFGAAFVFQAATFASTNLYITGTGFTTPGYFRCVMNPYSPGSSQTISSVSFIAYQDGLTRQNGDIAYNAVSGDLHVSADNGAGTNRYTVNSTDSGATILPDIVPAVLYNLAFGADMNLYAGIGASTTLRIVSPSTLATLVTPTALEFTSNDLAGYINQPCV